MLDAISNFFRIQFDLYRTDVVAVYALHDDRAGKPICEKLKQLYQDKKGIIFQELDGLGNIRSKRVANIKNHVILMPEEYGRISNIVDYLPLFKGQKTTVIQTVNREVSSQYPVDKDFSRIAIVEQNMYDAIVGNETIRGRYESIVSDVLLYDRGFRAEDYEERLLRFGGLIPSQESTTKYNYLSKFSSVINTISSIVKRVLFIK